MTVRRAPTAASTAGHHFVDVQSMTTAALEGSISVGIEPGASAPTAASAAEPDLVGANLATAIASDGNLQKQSMVDYPQNPHSSRVTPTAHSQTRNNLR